MNQVPFQPVGLLLLGRAPASCRAVVIIPARNEERSLPRCLDALREQVALTGEPLDSSFFEVLLLLNNTTDQSAEVVRTWQESNPTLALHVAERRWPVEEAHVGTARRWLMDTAWARLQDPSRGRTAILSTDADSVVAPDWVAQNLRALEQGADVVGGELSLLDEDVLALPPQVQRRYRQDRRYAALVARLEDVLDPQAGDRCPRHLDHFGASLACTPEVYAAAGGMPTLPSLEDAAFINAVRCANGTLRHDPRVRVRTSARLNGRAAVGMAGQLRMWQHLPSDEAHTVPSASFLLHRFRYMRELRHMFTNRRLSDLFLSTEEWKSWVGVCLEKEPTCPDFFFAINSEALIQETFHGLREQPIGEAVAEMERYLEDAAETGRGPMSSVPSLPSDDPDAAIVARELSGSRQ